MSEMLHGTIDLHIHTTCSDGQDTPEEIVDAYVQGGYTTIAITDHDSVDGVIRGLEAAKDKPIELIPGIELSSIEDIYDIHILGYYMNYDNDEFRKRIAFFKEKRKERAEEIVKNLNFLGLDIQFETVLRIAHGAPVGRPHIAEALLSEELIMTYNEAFARYIGDQGPAYVPKYKVTPAEAIELILNSGGIPSLAHPGVLNREEFIFELIEYGLVGLEAIHPLHTPEKQLYYEKLAKKYGLIVTGGSDWHGKDRRRSFKELINSRRVPQKTINDMKSFLKNRKRIEKELYRRP
ncbi:MAG: PHP domain-containing protein [Candidatus Latescibacteria bacterium]|nr:PHP domain-containing protein [Candidatus Latescibacterota bacterium]